MPTWAEMGREKDCWTELEVEFAMDAIGMGSVEFDFSNCGTDTTILVTERKETGCVAEKLVKSVCHACKILCNLFCSGSQSVHQISSRESVFNIQQVLLILRAQRHPIQKIAL